MTEPIEIEAALEETIEIVCEANSIELEVAMSAENLSESAEDADLACPNCGRDWGAGDTIGHEFLVLETESLKGASYLLTKDYWPYLTHYTKPGNGGSGLEVLRKILSDGEIAGSSKFITGQQSVVCFTECSPPEIQELIKATEQRPAKYRKEKFEWRRSPHGLAVQRAKLIEQGALPVIHGDDEIKESLPDGHLFRFNRFDRRGRFSDWTYEREFRVAGSVALDAFGEYELIVIVKDLYEKALLLGSRDVPRWPVMAFGQPFSRETGYPARTERQKAMWNLE